MPYILKAEELESRYNKTKVINKDSTDEQYPTAKAVYDKLNRIQPEGGVVDDTKPGLITDEGGEIFNDYENNKAIIEDSHSEGRETLAGSKVFKILGEVGYADEQSGYRHILVEGDLSNTKISEGDSVSIFQNNQYDDYGLIKRIFFCENSPSGVVWNKWAIELQSDSEFGLGLPEKYDSTKTNQLRVASKPFEGTETIGYGAHAEGWGTKALNKGSHAEGKNSVASGSWSHAEGNDTYANYSAHSEGVQTKAIGQGSHSEGNNTDALGFGSHAEGGGSKSYDDYAHSEGGKTSAYGKYAHSEGHKTGAVGEGAHSEGLSTNEITDVISNLDNNGVTSDWQGRNVDNRYSLAKGSGSHTEGIDNLSLGSGSHTEGNLNIAMGSNSHAGGYNNVAYHSGTFLHGLGLNSGIAYQSAFGQYNEGSSNNLFEIGNGTENKKDKRSNAFSVHKEGYAEVKTQGKTDNSVVTKKYLDDTIAAIEISGGGGSIDPAILDSKMDKFGEVIQENSTTEIRIPDTGGANFKFGIKGKYSSAYFEFESTSPEGGRIRYGGPGSFVIEELEVLSPTKPNHPTNKQYVDNLIGAIDEVLDAILASQQSYLGGDE